MARSLLFDQPATRAQPGQQATATAGVAVERLRRARSARYLDAVGQLDAGGRIADPALLQNIRDAIAQEFPDGPGTWPLGWVAKCYLGAPYEVHLLDVTGQIVQHYKLGEALPGRMERARGLAASGQYLVIEIFADRIVAIAGDGTTAVSMG